MSIRRVFIDWSTAALPSTAEYLCTRYASDGVLDLQRTIVVLPGARAGRRLLEILVDQAEARRLVLVPPRIVTAGQLPELLYEAQRPVANALTQQLAWVEALRHTDTRLLAHLTRHLPADHDLFAWFAFGELLATLHRELAGAGLTFADVATRGETLAAFRESERWHALLLPKALEETGACLAPWTPEELAHADHAAAEVVRQVRAEKFWPPSPGLFSYDDFAVICQVEQFGTPTTHTPEHED